MNESSGNIFTKVHVVDRFFRPALLWFYLCISVYFWFFARSSPEEAILIRLIASILSDLLWIPLGMLLWYKALRPIISRFFKSDEKRKRYYITSCLFVVIVFCTLVFHETAFRFLFAALILIAFNAGSDVFHQKFTCLPTGSTLPLLLLITATVVYYRGQMIPNFFPDSKDARALTVMTYNIRLGADYENRMNVVETIRQYSPDIVCCIETNPLWDNDIFREKIGDMYENIYSNERIHYARSRIMVFSKFPINEKEVTIPDSETGKADFSFLEVLVKGKKINLVCAHLKTVGHYLEKVHRTSGNIFERIRMTNEVEGRIAREKFQNVNPIVKSIAGFEEPTIICGDFNDTPNSRIIHLFNKYFRNTYSSKGWGLGATFGETWIIEKKKLNSIPYIEYLTKDFIRIDHIFINDGFTVISSGALENARGSDHKPVMTSLQLK